MLVRPGDRVKKGQALIQVDPRPLDLAVQDAEARLAQAQLQLLDNTVPDSIVSGKAITGERLRNAEIRSGLEVERVDLEQRKYDRERATIAAPFDGVMDDVNVAAGDRISAGEEVAKIVDLEHLRIEASVLEHDLPLIRVGGEALITVAAMPDQSGHGRIAAILPLVDSVTRAGRAVIRAGGDGMLRPGMYADVRLEATRLPEPHHRAHPRGDRARRPAAGVRGEGRPRPVDLHHPGPHQRPRHRGPARQLHRADSGEAGRHRCWSRATSR